MTENTSSLDNEGQDRLPPIVGHVTQSELYLDHIIANDNNTHQLIEEHSNCSTEELDTVPCESPATTDAGGYHGNHVGPYDQGGCVTYTHLQEGGVVLASDRFGVHSYENWSIILREEQEIAKRKRNLTKLKGMRGGMRQRPPQPLPR